MKMMTAMIRTTALGRILGALDQMGITGVSFSEVKEIGDQVGLSGPYETRNRIELVVPDDQAEMVASLIEKSAYSGLAGDGSVAITSLDYMIEIRTGSRLR